MSLSDDENNGPGYTLRLYILGAITLTLLGLLVLRLWHVQVQQGREHSLATLRQSIRPIRLNAVRGRIMASGGEVLVGNRSLFDAVYHVAEMRQAGRPSATVDYVMGLTLGLARKLGREMSLSAPELEHHMRVRPALPLTAFRELNASELALLAEIVPPVPGLEIVTRVEREYCYPGCGSHLLGYTGRERPGTTREMNRYPQAYVSLELHGWAGLERTYDQELGGVAGSRLVRVSALGYVHADIGTPVLPRNGNDLYLTLDLQAQLAAEKTLDDEPSHRRGALVVVDVHSGAVIAMASHPGYDLSKVDSAHHDSAYYRALQLNTVTRPLLNRAMQTYMPGSILKPLIGIAALESGAILPSDTYTCTGAFHLSESARIGCWNPYGHGEVDFVHAVEGSCNPYFINIGLATGLDRLRPFLEGAGIGVRPDLDLPPASFAAAECGICPSREYLARVSKGRRTWGYADTAFLSIGQGVVGVTPMQAALYTAAIANGGSVYRPFLVRSIRRNDGLEVRVAGPHVAHRIPARDEVLGLVRQGMYEVVNGKHGTAKGARNGALSLAGKTGTAEVGDRRHPHKDTWFIGFGPVEDPHYAIAILIEEGASGGRTAAPLAAAFLERWLLPDGAPVAQGNE